MGSLARRRGGRGTVEQGLAPEMGSAALCDVETAQGVTFGEAWAVGRYDGTTFTLTDPYAPLPTDPFEEETKVSSKNPRRHTRRKRPWV